MCVGKPSKLDQSSRLLISSHLSLFFIDVCVGSNLSVVIDANMYHASEVFQFFIIF